MSTYISPQIQKYHLSAQPNQLNPYNQDIKYGLSGELISDDMPYGGIPYNKILPKFEITANENGADMVTNLNDKNPYNDYVRSEIVNWGPDAPLFESDHVGRDPGQSRGKINLMYNGNRGNTADLPRHPEMFIGFTGNDPRGATNDPRLEQMRGFLTAHAGNLQVSMGTNDTNHIAERPWTNQAISYDKQYINKITKNNKKIFTTEKDGRLQGRNVVSDLPTWGANQNKIRESNMGAGGETIDNAGYGEYIDIGGTVNQVHGQDLQKIINMNSASIIKKYNSDQDYNDQLSNTNTGAGVTKYKNINLISTTPDHINIDSLKNNSSRNNTLSASMALASKNAAMIKKSNNGKQNMTNSVSDYEVQNSNIQQKIANSLQNIYKNTDMKGQNYNESNETANGKGFTQKKTTEIGKHVIYDTNLNISHGCTNTELTNTIVKGLKEGMDKSKLASQVLTHINLVTIGDENIISKSLTPSKDYIKNNVDLDNVRSALFKSKITDDTMIHKYPLKMKKEKKVHFGKNADINNWTESYNTQNGKTVRYNDDQNRTNKGINALSQTQWQNSKEMQMLKSKNPELYNKVQNDINNSTMEWKESKYTQGGMTPHQQITPGGAKIFKNTYTPDVWNAGYNSLAQGKTVGLNRKVATKEPTTFGTTKEELFKNNDISFTSPVNGRPKSLRASSNIFNDHTLNELNDVTA
jgi:hypothetical protein